VFEGVIAMIDATSGVSERLKALPLLLLAALVVHGSQAAYGQQKTETPQQTNAKITELATLARTRPHEVPIGTGDMLHVDVFDVPELSRDLRVSETGDISYPLVPGRIRVTGLTTYQLEQKLGQLLIENGLVTHPQVSVFVREQNSQPVSIVGAVVKPGVIQIIRPTTLLELLADSGGIVDDAGSYVIITRKSAPPEVKAEAAVATEEPPPVTPPDELTLPSQIITIRLQDLLESGNPVYNIAVYGGDVISVPRAGIVYVTGAGVSQPGGYVLQSHGEQITVMKAVALAHGLTSFSKSDDAVIMRSNAVTGQRDIIPVHIKQIENHKSDDMAMKSNDILYIPDSVGKKVLARGAEAAVSVGSGIAMFRAY
jgi:polysaccharide biosynthesis/export protein